MSEYTPTTKDVREVWIYAQDITHDEGEDFHGAEFDRWLAAHDAEVREEAWDAGFADRHGLPEATALLSDRERRNPHRAAGVVAEEPEWEYGTRRPVTDGWERGDTYGEHEYIDARSISDNINEDRSTTLPRRDMTRAVRRRKAGPWLPVES